MQTTSAISSISISQKMLYIPRDVTLQYVIREMINYDSTTRLAGCSAAIISLYVVRCQIFQIFSVWNSDLVCN